MIVVYNINYYCTIKKYLAEQNLVIYLQIRTYH